MNGPTAYRLPANSEIVESSKTLTAQAAVRRLKANVLNVGRRRERQRLRRRQASYANNRGVGSTGPYGRSR